MALPILIQSVFYAITYTIQTVNGRFVVFHIIKTLVVRILFVHGIFVLVNFYANIECCTAYESVAEIACRYCCITMHLNCLPQREGYDPMKPYICPRHLLQQKVEQKQVPKPPLQTYNPPIQYPQNIPRPQYPQFIRPMYNIPRPGFIPTASVGHNPQAYSPNKRIIPKEQNVKECIEKKEEKKIDHWWIFGHLIQCLYKNKRCISIICFHL